MYSELVRHDSQRRTLLVACRGVGDRLVGHLVDHAPSGDAGLVEVVDDGGPVDLVPTGESIDRSALAIQLGQPVDLAFGQPSLHRV